MVKVLCHSSKKHETWHKHRLLCAVANEKGNQKILPPRSVYFTDQIFKLQFHCNFTKYCLNTCIMTTSMLTQWHFLHKD